MEKYYKQEIKTGEQYRFGEGAVQKSAGERDPEMWHLSQGGGLYTAPIMLGDVIFFGAFDSYFYALNKITGAVVWKFKTGDVVISSPALENNMIVFGSQDGFVYCLDETGKIFWKYRTGGKVFTNAVFYKENIYIGSSNGYMHRFSYSGDLLWRYKTGSAIYSTPAFVNDKLYFGSYDKHFYCLNTKGELVWKYYVGEWVDNSPAIFADGEEIWSFAGKSRDYQGSASVCFGAYNKNFYVLNADSGALQWMRRVDGIVSFSHPVIKEGKIYFGDWSGYLYCLDAESGRIEWKVLTGGIIDFQPLVYSGFVYFGSHDGNLYALSLEGKISWKFQTGGVVGCRPVIDNNILYFGSMDTVFYAINIATRRVVWKFVTGGGKPAPLKEILQMMDQLKETQKIFSGWRPELVKPKYKEDKALTFIAPPSEHGYAMKEPYKTESPYQMQQKKKKEPWER